MQNQAKPRIVILDAETLGDDVDIAPVTDQGEVTVHGNTAPDQTAERVRDADVVIANKVIMSPDALTGSAVRMIAITATGTNNVDLEYCKANSIAVANVAGYSTQSVVQQTASFVLQLVGQATYYQGYIAAGSYPRSPIFTHYGPTWFELAGKRWGIVGLGTIGRSVAAVAQAFGCEVVYHSTSGRNTDQPYQQLSLAELLQTSDVVTVHAPLNENTKGLIGADELAQMKPHAVIVNMGRGGIIDEAALAQAVASEQIGGAATDVFSSEPPEADNPLMKVKANPLFLATPHTAWASLEARTRLVAEVAENIRAFLSGTERNRVV
jgi:glycerate dehydrogenase